MEIGTQPLLKFGGIDIFDVRFSSIKKSIGVSETVNLDIQPRVLVDENNSDRFKIYMHVSLKLEQYFDLTLQAIGYFELSNASTVETRKLFISNNAPAIMFPYIRSFITSFTSNLGNVTGAVIIPPHFFRGDIQELKPAESPKLSE